MSSPNVAATPPHLPSAVGAFIMCPVAPLDSTVAQRLRHAIESADVSVRALSVRLSKRDDVTASADSLRRSLSKWLAGDTIGVDYQAILEDELGCPPGYLYEADVTALRQRDVERRLRAIEQQVALMQARQEAMSAVVADLSESQEVNSQLLETHESRLAEAESALARLRHGQGSVGTGTHLE